MNKTELIAAVAKKSGLTKVDAAKAVNATMETITATVNKKENVVLLGFGSFVVKERKARTGINPQTKKPIKIAAKKVVKFISGKGFQIKK